VVGHAGILHGRVAPILIGKRDRKLQLLVRGKTYVEDQPTTAPNGRQLTLAPVDRDVDRESAQFRSGKRTKGSKNAK
jgi:hypothetical protein